MKEVAVMHFPTMERLARQVAEGEEFRARFGTPLFCNVRWEAFPDGYPNLFVDNAMALRGHKVVFFADFFDPAQLFPQLSLVYALPRLMVASLTVVLPYFPTGTMERVELEGQVATAKTLTRMLSATPPTQQGPARIMIYDIHALAERFYFADSIFPLLETAVPLFIRRLEAAYAEEKAAGRLSIAFPDEGACKRFGKSFSELGFPVITCIKVRDGDRRIVKIKEGDVAGQHVFVVDDLVQSGGTLLQCKEALWEGGAAKVSAYVTHAIFPKDSWRRFLGEERGFDKFYLTDSCPSRTGQLDGHAPFHILSLAPSVTDALTHCL